MSKSLVSKINIVLRGIQLISIHLVGGNFGQGQICIRGRRGLLTTMWQLAGCTVWWVLKGGEGYLWGRWGWRWPTIYIGLQILAIFPLPIEIILCFQVTFLIMMYGMDNCYNVQCYNDNDNICGMTYIYAAECDHFTFSNTIWPHSLSPFLRNDIKPRVHHIRDNAVTCK